ncbi:MAG: hypothetical protein KGN33_01955 [Paracoccaceae bacterium]|nr:hypothetical protein [Paracoccaceae bacterium]
MSQPKPAFNILIVAQAGRLEREALLFAGSLMQADPDRLARLFIAEPQPGPLWPEDPRIGAQTRGLLTELGATVLPFAARHFGAAYPHGNKIEALAALPPGEPFVFFDTDTLILSRLDQVPFDFDRPTASLRREGTWPVIELYGPGYTRIWKSLYDRFGLDFESSLDRTEPDEFWRRYLYFNAGWFFHRDPAEFGRRFVDYARTIRDDPPPELALQPLDPWLDQVALPLVIHALGGGRGTLPEGLLDGRVSCHYRLLPLLYARESEAAVEMLERVMAVPTFRRLLKDWAPVKRFVLQGEGAKARALFDRDNLPRREQAIRNLLKREGLWVR